MFHTVMQIDGTPILLNTDQICTIQAIAHTSNCCEIIMTNNRVYHVKGTVEDFQTDFDWVE